MRGVAATILGDTTVSIVRIGLGETKGFHDGYDAIFGVGKKGASGSVKKAAAKKPSAKAKKPATKKPAKKK